MKKLLIAIAVLVALVWGGWLVALPSGMLLSMAEDAAKRGGMELKVHGFKKGLFYNVSAESIELVAKGKTMLTIEHAAGRLVLPSLFKLKARVPFSAELAGGTVNGTAVLRRSGYAVQAKAEGVELAGLGLENMVGHGIEGTFRGEGEIMDGFGKTRFIVDDARIAPVTVQGMQVPLNMFTSVKGALHVDGPKVDIDSIAFEGDGLYARVTGTVQTGNADIELEFMPEERAIPDAILQGIIGQYRVSRGHYVIPYKGPLRGAL